MENLNHSSSPTLHPLIKQLLENRNIMNLNEFFSWDLQSLPSFSALKDYDKAIDRIIAALENKEKIGIYGDYDVDGTTSCALFYHFFQMVGFKVDLIQPSRFVEGYGIHPSSIEDALAKDIKLLITVDCGITNVETAEYANERNLHLIITDHHKDIREVMPPAYAIVNPNRRDENLESELTSLAGVGVAFAICVGLRQKLIEKSWKVPSLYPLLEFVAIGTISDLAKMTPLNMKLTRHGLKHMTQTEYPGIKQFIPPEERNVAMIPSEKVSFYIGPMINSKGRLDHPDRALRLLIAETNEEAYENFSYLEIANRERKFIQAEVFNSAKEQVIAEMTDQEHLISIVFHPEWHEGVIGIVASKLVDIFKAPAVVFTEASEQGIIKASARSFGEIDIFSLLNECSDLFVKFGGHKAAAGLSMPLENYIPFKNKMNRLMRQIPHPLRNPLESFDLFLKPHDITASFVKALQILEPFGLENERPIFKMSDFRIDSYQILKDQHVKWFLSDRTDPNFKMQGISFFYIGRWQTPHPEELFELQNDQQLQAIFSAGINRFNGKEYLQLMIEKIVY